MSAEGDWLAVEIGVFNAWLVGLCLSQLGLSVVFGFVPLFREKPAVAAFEVICLYPCVWLAYYGIIGHWEHCSGNPYPSGLEETEARLLTPLPEARRLLTVLLVYSIWGTVVCLVLPPLRKTEIVLHHITTAATATLVMISGFGQNYAFFFCGVQELSSTVLCFVDFMKEFKMHHWPAPAPTLFFGFKVVFALSFVAIRNIYWPWHSWRLWGDYFRLLSAGNEKVGYAPMAVFALYIFITYLQYLWGRIIINNSMEALGLPKPFPTKTDKFSAGYEDIGPSSSSADRINVEFLKKKPA